MSTRKKSDALEFLETLTGGPLTLGRLIETIRITDELTQAGLAKKLGISRSHLNDIEKGNKAVSPGRAVRFARALGYSERQFLTLSLQAILDLAKLKFKVNIEAA